MVWHKLLKPTYSETFYLDNVDENPWEETHSPQQDTDHY